MRLGARAVLIAVILLAGCHKKTSAPPPPPPPAPQAKLRPSPVQEAPEMAAMPPPPPQVPAPPPPAVPQRPAALLPAAGAGTGGSGRPAGVHHADTGRSPASTGNAVSETDAQQIHTWYQNLPNGFVRYTAPTPMILGNQYTASAYIPAVGAALGASTADPKTATTIDKNIKVSPYMRVSLAAPANPDTFKIDSPVQDCKFVSLDGSTRWNFLVTPIHSGKDETLTFTTTVLYGDGTDACNKANPKTIDVTTDTETVQVQAINARDTEQKLKDDAVEHPGKWFGYLKYILPGGAVFTFFAGIVAWWKKRSAAKPAP